MNEVEVKTECTFTLDLKGNAHIEDKKIVRNLTDTEQHLTGPFKQGIRSPFDGIKVTDSDGNNLKYHMDTDKDTADIELFFSPPTQEFIIPAGGVKWFTVEYDVYKYAREIGDGLLLKTNCGNTKYTPNKFDHFTFTHNYQFDINKGKSFLHRMFYTYKTHSIGFDSKGERKGNRIIVKTSGVLSRRETQVNIVFLEVKFRKVFALLLASVGGAGIKEIIAELIRVIFK